MYAIYPLAAKQYICIDNVQDILYHVYVYIYIYYKEQCVRELCSSITIKRIPEVPRYLYIIIISAAI